MEISKYTYLFYHIIIIFAIGNAKDEEIFCSVDAALLPGGTSSTIASGIITVMNNAARIDIISFFILTPPIITYICTKIPLLA